MGKWVGDTYRWTTEEKLADLLSSFHGEEYDEKRADLLELVAAVRRDQADRIGKLSGDLGTGPTAAGFRAFGEKIKYEISPDTPDTV